MKDGKGFKSEIQNLIMIIQTIKEKFINYFGINEEKSDREYKKEYEKISAFTFSMDKKASKSLTLSALFFSLFIYFLISYFLIISQKLITKILELQFLGLIIIIMFLSFLITFSFFMVFAFIGILNENFRFYNLNRIINIYFLELTKKLDPSDMYNATKNILYNLTKLKMKISRRKEYYGLLPAYNIVKYLKFKKYEIRTMSTIVSKTIEFVNFCLIFINKKEYSSIFKKLGNLYQKENYKDILNLLENSELNDKIDKSKKFLNIEDYSKMNKIVHIVKDHSPTMYYIVVIIFTILFIFGIVKLPPTTGL